MSLLEYLVLGMVLFVIFFPLRNRFKSGSVTRQFFDLINVLGLKVEQVRGDSATLIGRYRDRYVTILVDIKRQVFKATLVAPCGLLGTIRWQTPELETLSEVGSLQDVQVGDPELDDRFLFDFEASAEESARLFLRQSRTKAFLMHSFGSGMELITLTPTAITAKWAISSAQDVNPTVVRELFEGLLALAELSWQAAGRTGQDQSHDRSVAGRAPAGSDAPSPLASRVAAGTSEASPLPDSPLSSGGAAIQAASVFAAAPADVESPKPPVSSMPVPKSQAVSATSPALPDARLSITGQASASAAWEAESGKTGSAAPAMQSGEKDMDLPQLLRAGATDRVAARVASDLRAAGEVVSLLSDFSLRTAAMKALADAGRAAVPALVDRCSDLLLASSIRDVLGGGGEEVEDALVEELGRRTDDRQIEFLLDLVDRMQIKKALPVLRRLSQQGSFMVRSKAEQLAARLEESRGLR